MKIYIPERNKMISNASIINDQFNSVLFVDTTDIGTEYYCVSDDYYLSVDSIVQDQPSTLRDMSNGADYIIITHPEFIAAAEDLAQFRSGYFPDPDIVNVRIKIVDVMQIYDEFSYGLLDPFALQYFIKYAFDNWQSPAPSYIVLMGDMSYDYRGLLEDSDRNFIPSIPIFVFIYGQAISDNMFVAVAGEDITPDLAIGRLSCETLDEANLLVDKLIKYPDDNAKEWKENVLLLASGLSVEDENSFNFNNASLLVGDTFVIPFGYNASYVFNFATQPRHFPYEGGQIEIREEISKGAALVNYYGHGGGLQWDLVFTNDDIYLLENGGRLPVILSVTCYTAHFDNQKVFGEQFNLVENKGSIGFYGSTGLTYWGIGKSINNKLFTEILTKNNLIIGKAILNSKNQVSATGLFGTQIALLVYLGDPAMEIILPKFPDFAVSSADITLSPENPIVNDTVSVKININNLGRIFPDDSVVVELYISSADTNFLAGSEKLSNFGDKDSVIFSWIPSIGNLYELTAKVNETEIIIEEDHSDNIASQFFVVFNISEPNILKPIDGFSTTLSKIKFAFSDVGKYINKNLSYSIEIDTSLGFENPIMSSGMLTSENALVEWQSSDLPQGTYFWRARIFDGSEFGNWSALRSFSISSNEKSGYYAHGKILKTFTSYNINYSDSAQSLSLNTELLPARPFDNTFLEDIYPQPSLPDSLKLTTLTTDGSYFYFGNLKFFANGKSAIYRVGTGNNGTVKGKFDGPFSNFYDDIENSIVYHSDGYIYVATGNPYELTRIKVSTEVIDTVEVPDGLLKWDTGTVGVGSYYLTSDGKYIYNLASIDSLGNRKYTLRTFDPANGFEVVGSDLHPPGESFEQVSGFFVFGDYFYPVESFFSNTIRRIRISDGFFEEEWHVRSEFESYYSWCSDWVNNTVSAGVYRASGFEPKISTFFGNYIDANGSIITKPVGPAAWWKSLSFDLLNPNPTGEYSADLLGFNSSSKLWDTIKVNLQTPYSLIDINAKEYPKLQIYFTLTDSSFTNNSPIELKSVNIDYQELPNVMFVKSDLQFSPDSILQGFPVTMNFKARNFGETNIDSLNIKFYLNGLDSVIYSKVVSIPADSISENISYIIESDHLLFENEIRAFGTTDQLEYFSFDNLIENQFFVARDSVRPIFSITFDGKEIINGDIVSAKPDVMILLEDNSPLPLDTSFFTIVYNNVPLYFTQPELSYEYTSYPNSKSEIHWTPELPDGKHTLEILAKDASGNFFDSTSSRTSFFVFNEFDLTEVYNYPNPFSKDTYFTFSLQGSELPENVKIKIYTIAGRLIHDVDISALDLNVGFNKIYWDGKDQDGDEVANGVYLYKVSAKFPEETKTVTQKLARVR
ncbi:MAG: hypothetical protein IIA49_14020 [Bacteroidetes bacterium]|nr:hypothetical protein [Bacteroidota bacterium]